MIQRFSDFQNLDPYSKKIGIVGESCSLPDLFGDENSELVIYVQPNPVGTHGVISKLSGSDIVPNQVGSRFAAQSLKLPITVVSPRSEIKTFQTKRALNQADLIKGSHYFTRPNFSDRVQVASHRGSVIGARQIVDGKPVHLDLERHPRAKEIKRAARQIHEAAGSDLSRFQLGLGSGSPVFLLMENFSLLKPELVNLYFKVHESALGQLPAWYKHKIYQTILKPYLTEYINREELSKKCPYLL